MKKKKKKKKMPKFLAVAATTTMVVSSLGTDGSALAATATESEAASTKQSPQQAKVSVFDLYGKADMLKAYNEHFKVGEDVKISSNAGVYGGSLAKYALDGNRNTHWETNNPNSNNHKNALEFTFTEETELDRIIYAPRVTGAPGKGFPVEFEIQGISGDSKEYQVVATGSYNGNKNNAIEIQIEPTKFKKLKFVFKNASEGYAAASEVMFYKEDSVSAKVSDLFTNGLMNELKPEYKSMEKIEQMESEIATHPLKILLQEYIDLAKAVLNQQVDNTAIITASQRGNANAMASKYQIARTSFSLDSFGRYVTPGETIQVFVDADKYGVMPTLVFGQIADDKNGWHRKYTLKPGLNTITAPAYSNMKPAAIYIENGALPTEQAYAPKVRLVGGTKFPVYYHGKTDPAEFEKELEEYVAKISVNDNDFANGKPTNGKVYNIAELVSENNTISTSAAGALKGIQEMKSIGKTVKDTMDEWEMMWNEFQKLSGNFKVEKDPTKFFTAKFTSRVFTKGPYGWSDWGYTGYNGGNSARRDGGFFKQIVKPFSAPGNDGWAYYHEWGHNINNSAMEHVEITNNLYSVVMRKVFQNSNDDRVDWNSLYKRFSRGSVAQGYWTSLGILQQVQYYYGQDTYGKATQLSIQNPNGIFNGLNRQQRMVVAFSLATNTDLTEFFNDWGYCTATQAMKEKVKHLPKPSVKLEYMNTLGSDYTGSGFSAEAKVTVNSLAVNANNNTIKLTYDIDAANKDASMGYEILRNGEVVGYTTNTSFVDKNIDPNENYTYQIVAYDKKLNTAKPTEVKSFKPTISAEDQLTLKLGQDFNPREYVKALDYKGTDITDMVEVNSDVNVNEKGSYKVTYTVASQGITETKTMNVTVTSDFDYLSDLQVKSHNIAWGGLKLNKAPQGTPITLLRDGVATIYEKGIGAHANSEVVYDIEGKGYNYFESYIGIDQAMAGNNSSATFKVLVDGEEAYTSGVFGSGTEHAFIKVPIKAGAKTVKLVTTDAGSNGNTADHTVWADAKFTKDSSKPVISITSEATKVGVPIDIEGEYKATDTEDGDLTSLVKVTGTEAVDFNKAGDYEITYTVSDNDGNEVTATRTISVVDMQDFKYLSDYNWTSESHTYAVTKKDTATGSNNKIRLTGENGKEVVYDKGLGAHSTSRIVYDLADKEAAYFSAYVGVDRQQYGRVGSVEFKVLVDGVEKYTSGVMQSTDKQKYVEVSLAGAKKLELVVTDGGNGEGSDHASWGNAKLHYANEERSKVLKTEKDSTVKEKPVTKETTSQKGGKDEVVAIEDNRLANAIKAKLDISGDVTVGAMSELTELDVTGLAIESLKGLENATNLVNLVVDQNAILDFSPLKDLTKLKLVTLGSQFRAMGEVTTKGNVATIKNEAINKNGDVVTPYSVSYFSRTSDVSGRLTDDELKANTESFQIDLKDQPKGGYYVNVTYNVDGGLVSMLYMVNNVAE